MTKLATNETAIRWMDEGIKQAQMGRASFLKYKECTLNAAFFFFSARQSLPDGAWGEFLIGYDHKIAARTVRFYVQVAEAAIEWVKKKSPGITGVEKIMKAAKEMALQSPKPFVALLREEGFMRKFGEYDSVKYATTKRLGNGGSQIEFEFTAVASSLDLLTHLGDENYQFIYPEDKNTTEALAELETKLETALTRVRTIKQHGRVIEA